MKISLLSIALAGLSCACTPKAPLLRSMIGGQLRDERRPLEVEQAGDCSLSTTVRVVDAAGAPIGGARVEAHQRESERAAEETLAVYDYFAAPVTTDPRGEGRICAPGKLLPEPEFQGWGGGYSYRDAGSLVVSYADRRFTVSGPFPDATIVAREPPRR